MSSGSEDQNDWEQDILAAIEPKSNSKRKKYMEDSDEGEIEDGEEVSEDEETKTIRLWKNTGLMGNEADRKRLMRMSELDREMELAERRKKVDQWDEDMNLKAKVQKKATTKRIEYLIKMIVISRIDKEKSSL
jgi:hypothetical protein